MRIVLRCLPKQRLGFRGSALLVVEDAEVALRFGKLRIQRECGLEPLLRLRCPAFFEISQPELTVSQCQPGIQFDGLLQRLPLARAIT